MLNKKAMKCEYSVRRVAISRHDSNVSLTCICKTGYIWDVISNSCISPCAVGDRTCLDCTAVINTDGSAAVLASTLANNTRAAFDGSDAILKLVNITTTNYGKISKNQCQCL